MNELTVVDKANEWRRMKGLVLDSVRSPITKRVYNMALDEFFDWYRLEPRPGFAKATVNAWRVSLDERGLGSSSIIVRMSAIRQPAVQATDNGLLAPELPPASPARRARSRRWPARASACGGARSVVAAKPVREAVPPSPGTPLGLSHYVFRHAVCSRSLHYVFFGLPFGRLIPISALRAVTTFLTVASATPDCLARSSNRTPRIWCKTLQVKCSGLLFVGTRGSSFIAFFISSSLAFTILVTASRMQDWTK